MRLRSFVFLLFFIPLFITAQSGINSIGSFEQEDPSYWHKGSEPGGSQLTWAKDQYVTMGRSLKITKELTGEAAMWESANMCDIWSPVHNKDVDLKIGAWVKTEGLNTNPQNDDERWFISYTFMNQAGGLIGEVKLPVNQTTASSNGWVEVTNEVGSLILPEDSYTTIIKFIGGKNAKGTVWADEFMLNGRTDWAGGIWNETVGVPEGWIYWLPRTDGQLSDGYQNTRITDEEAYHGKYSLKFDIPKGTHDGFIGTRFFPLNNGSGLTARSTNSNDIAALENVKAGDVIRISVWIKASNLEPDSVDVVGDQWSVSLTPIFHNTMGGNEGFGDIWASDIPLIFPKTKSFDWTQFYVDVRVVEGAKSIDVRLHPLGRFQGTVYMDALEIKKISDVTEVENQWLPVSFNLFQNYPNPFNPSTIISYAIPQSTNVHVAIYDMLGREIKTLVNNDQNAGVYSITWNGENNYGNKVSSGTYIYRINAGEFVQARKMLLIK